MTTKSNFQLVTQYLSLVTVFQDIRYGIRMLWKNKAVTVFAVIALAVGIGANTALFSLIHGVLLSPLPFPEPEQLMWVQTHYRQYGSLGSCSGPDYLDFEKENTVFEGLSAMQAECKFSLTGLGEPKALIGFRVTANFFDTFYGAPFLGRGFIPEEAGAGKNHVVILSHKLWVDLFDSDRDIVGKSITLGGEPSTVIGVAEPTMGFIEEMAQLYVPLPVEDLKQNRSSHYLGVMGRLKSGISIEQARSEMSLIASRLEQEYVDSNKNKGVAVHPLKEILIQEIQTAFFVLYGAVGFLLLITCVNIANLLMAKSGTRSKEIAIRSALGAGRVRIFRQVLTESIVLSVLGGGLGLLLGFWGLDGLRLIAPRMSNTTGTSVPGLDEISLNPTVLGFTIILSLLTGILFGLLPAWYTSRTSINETLKEGGRGASRGSSRHRILSALVVSEIALAMILLVGSGLLIKNFYQLQTTSPGFDPNHLLAVHLERPYTPFNSENRNRAAFYKKAIQQIKSLPGVVSADAVNIHPMTPSNSNNGFYIDGRPLPAGEYLSAEFRTITMGYFKTMKIPLVQGRNFTVHDNEESKRVIIVNQEFVRRYLPNEDPISKRIVMNNETFEIAGVVGNVKLRTLSAENNTPFLYLPVDQECWHMMTVLVRTKGDPLRLANAARREIWDIDPNQPIMWVRTMNQVVGESIGVERFCAILLSVMGGVALLLAIIGIYGVMAFAVSERTHEIGIRMALGARVGNILHLIIHRGMVLAVIGIVIGLAGSFALTRLMSSMLYHMTATDPFTFILVSIVLLTVSLLACYLPARRAAKTDPMVTLRCE